ncbi:MAG: MFS transporter [Chloroflexi bacterium]|nr:MFS transporter [Chloroflexota bacterium]
MFPGSWPRPHYGWLVLAVSFVTQALTYGVWYSFSVFFVALLADFGWSRASASGVFSVFVIVTAASGPLVGKLIDRLGARWIIPLGGILLAGGLALSARMAELWQFYVFYGLVAGLGVGICGWIAQITMLVRWFPRSMGAVTGISSSGVGVGIFVLIPEMQHIIDTVGWRSAYDVLALAVLLGIVPANLLLARNPTAREFGAIVAGGGRRGRAAPESALIVDRAWASQEWTVARALRTSRFWLLFGAALCGSFAQQLVLVHQVAYFADLGFPVAVGALVVGLIGIASVFGKVTWGALSDRWGRELAFSLGTATVMSSAVTLLVAGVWPTPWMPYLFGLLIGVGYAVSAPLSSGTATDLFKGPNFGSIFGTLGAANGIGSAVGPWFAGLVFDLTGSYQEAFLVGLVGCAVAIVAYWVAAPRRVRRVPGSVRARALPQAGGSP